MARAWGDSGYYHDRGQSRHGEPWLEGKELSGADQARYEDWRDAKLSELQHEKPTVELELKRIHLTKKQANEVMKSISKLHQGASMNDKKSAALQKIKTFFPDVVEFGKGYRDSDWYVDVPQNSPDGDVE